jgi:glutathione S-transferase
MLASLARLNRGIYTRPAAVKPERLLELYDIEACPFCRLVRETLTELDLDAMVYPCPKGGTRFRPKAVELGGKAQFPFLVDPNTGRQLYESADIIAYLFQTYGRRPVPLGWRLRPLNATASGLASLSRLGAGARRRPSVPAAEPLELFSIETSPFARRVRERLCELELAYRLRNVGRTQAKESLPPALRDRLGVRIAPETANRKALLERTGRLMVPYLIDPNTTTELFESDAILRYLDATYGAPAVAAA